MPSLTDRCHVTVPLVIYSATGFMFFPVFQSLIYNKVCLQSQNETGMNESTCLDRSITSKHHLLQTKANHVLLISTVAISLMAMLAAPILGSVSDRKSRKLAMLLPFIGLILEDLTLILQAHFMAEASVYYVVLSELIFGVFGGYMSVFSTTFAFAAHLCKDDKERKSKTMALLEGCLGLGGEQQ
uniref:Solute carrier family 46 member 3 n=1 Tax=Plectus sambesii TaxID=2011161 RepID=A0A914XAI2_9BILA